jgi:hypothetical protein
MKGGYLIVQNPEALVLHPVRPASWGVSIRQQEKSMDNALLFRKHPELYWRFIEDSPPWKYYIIVGISGAALSAAGMRMPWMASFGFVVWASLIGKFTTARLRNTSREWKHIWEMIVTSSVIPYLSVFWRLLGALYYRVPFL